MSSKVVLPLPPKGGKTISTTVTTVEDASINHVLVRLHIAHRCFHPVVTARVTDCFTTVVASPAHRALKISIRVADSVRFPGGAPGRARQILDTLRRAPTITAPPGLP